MNAIQRGGQVGTLETILLILSLVIAVIAALMPLWQFLINKWFRKLKIAFFEDEELYISSYSVNSLFTMDVKNKDIIIREVSLKIRRNVDNRIIELKWDCHVSTNFKGMDADAERRIAYPFKVNKGSCEVFHLKYLRLDDEYSKMKEAGAEVVLLRNELNKKRKSTFSVSSQEIVKEEKYQQLYNGFANSLFWQEGDYELIYHVRYNESLLEQKFAFSLTKEDEQVMRVNIQEYLLGGVVKEMKTYSRCIKIERENDRNK